MDEIYEILNSYKSAIDVILERLDALQSENSALNEQVNTLHSLIFDEILEPARQAIDRDETEKRFGEFKGKYDERLGGAYNDVIRARENDPEFDLTRNAFDFWDSLPSEQKEGITEDKYVEDFISDVDKSINALKESLGIPVDQEVTVKQDEEGKTTVEDAEGNVIAEESETETEEVPEEASKEEVETVPSADEEGQGEFDFSDDEEKEDDPEELKKYEEELAGLLG